MVEDHGERVDPETVASLLRITRVRAGNSADKQLWRERILFVSSLWEDDRLPSKA